MQAIPKKNHFLLNFFKVLADETRLQMIQLLAQREYNVSELAVLLELSEPTISHHLVKLRKVGLTNIRVDANNRYSRLNEEMLKQMKQYVMHLEKADAEVAVDEDKSWVQAVDLSDEDKKVLWHYTFNQRITQLPRKLEKLQALLRWLTMEFHDDVIYSERQVNDIILKYHEDYASLRRDLIEFGYLQRNRGGRSYWRNPEQPPN